MNEYLKMLKRMEEITNTPSFKKVVEARKKIEKMINPEQIKRTESVYYELSRTGLESYLNQLNQMQTSVKSIEFVDLNQNFYNQIQSIQNKLNNSIPDLTRCFSDAEEIDDEVVETFQNDYTCGFQSAHFKHYHFKVVCFFTEHLKC